MNTVDISKIDLNLLVALDVLLQERNVTRAARRLHLTQSATSHALARLRDQLQDPLLIRSGREMRLTPKALRLSLELPRILRSLDRVLRAEDTFDPVHSERVFVLGAPDFASVLLPQVLHQLRQRAPRASVEFLVADEGIERELVEGRMDIGIGSALRGSADDIRSEPLPDARWVVFARADHPARHAWNTEAWQTWPHVLVRRGRDLEGVVDSAARRIKLKRRVGAYVPQFVHAAPLLASTDLLMTAPKLAFAGLARSFGLVALELPIAIEPVKPRIHSLLELSRNPALSMFREVVLKALATLDAVGGELPVVPVQRRRAVAR